MLQITCLLPTPSSSRQVQRGVSFSSGNSKFRGEKDGYKGLRPGDLITEFTLHTSSELPCSNLTFLRLFPPCITRLDLFFISGSRLYSVVWFSLTLEIWWESFRLISKSRFFFLYKERLGLKVKKLAQCPHP